MQEFGIDEKIIENIVNIIKKYKVVESVKIFGSRARGDYREQSDIDIALFGDNVTHTTNTEIFYEIEQLYIPYKIDLINFNTLEKELALKNNILKEGVSIYVK